mgnify:CR=1 FL=1
MFAFLSSFTNQNSTNNIISDCDIKNKNVIDITELQKNKQNDFKLTNMSLHNAFEENNIDKIKYLKNNFPLSLPGNGNYHVDVSTENGNGDMAKFLVTELKCEPSLYAKQMATVNGHTNLSLWMNVFAKQRNETGINIVHRHFNKEKKMFVWDEIIPEQFRYM